MKVFSVLVVLLISQFVGMSADCERYYILYHDKYNFPLAFPNAYYKSLDEITVASNGSIPRECVLNELLDYCIEKTHVCTKEYKIRNFTGIDELITTTEKAFDSLLTEFTEPMTFDATEISTEVTATGITIPVLMDTNTTYTTDDTITGTSDENATGTTENTIIETTSENNFVPIDTTEIISDNATDTTEGPTTENTSDSDSLLTVTSTDNPDTATEDQFLLNSINARRGSEDDKTTTEKPETTTVANVRNGTMKALIKGTPESKTAIVGVMLGSVGSAGVLYFVARKIEGMLKSATYVL